MGDLNELVPFGLGPERGPKTSCSSAVEDHGARGESDVPCLGRRIYSVDGDDFDCDYEHAPPTCEDCIVNGGTVDPRVPRPSELESGGET